MTVRRSALALVAVLVVGGAVAFAPALPSASAAPCAASDLHVAMVVDFGDGATVTSTCVPVASGANGAAALFARASLLGTKDPQLNGGFVCAIDGYPNLDETGCAASSGDGTFAYWSYWHGTGGTWTYSSRGAASRVQADVVEGWRYLPHGRDTPDMPPPGGSAAAGAICVAAPPATTAPPDVVGDPASTPSPAGGAGPASTGAGPGAAPTTTTEDATTTTAPAVASTTTTTGARSSASDRAAPVVTVGAGAGGGGGGSPLGLLAGIGAVGALAGGGAVVIRRRAGPG